MTGTTDAYVRPHDQLADSPTERRCWILTFDSLGGYHKAVTNKLKSYLISEAMSKLGKQPEELSIDQVQCGRADVSTDWLSPRLAATACR